MIALVVIDTTLAAVLLTVLVRSSGLVRIAAASATLTLLVIVPMTVNAAAPRAPVVTDENIEYIVKECGPVKVHRERTRFGTQYSYVCKDGQYYSFTV